MNEYRTPELNVQNGVLKSLSFMFEYIGEMGKDYINAVTPLLQDALMDRDMAGAQVGARLGACVRACVRAGRAKEWGSWQGCARLAPLGLAARPQLPGAAGMLGLADAPALGATGAACAAETSRACRAPCLPQAQPP